jgi:hypothetical protein
MIERFLVGCQNLLMVPHLDVCRLYYAVNGYTKCI